jgi:ABC-type branched-subunit amino acid transport system ATPase component
VGPNGVGKTSVLEALHLLGQIHYKSPGDLFTGARTRDALLRHISGITSFELSASGSEAGQPRSMLLRAHFSTRERLGEDGEPLQERVWKTTLTLGGHLQAKEFAGRFDDDHSLYNEGYGSYWSELRNNVILRLDARDIATPSVASTRARVQYDGSGVPTVIANLKLADEPRLERIIADLRRVVPNFKTLRVLPATVYISKDGNDTAAGYRLVFDMDSGRDIPASGVSEGTLIALALLTVLHSPGRPRLLLLDDVHEALHPKAQKRLMDVLKELASGEDPVQIVATTHSPYILDCVEPKAVQVLAQRPDGTTAVRSLSEHPEAAAYLGALSSGQLWTLDDEQSWVP